ncbi:MAG TPA: sensor histidine kinase [Pseudomonas sp.]|jgi:signal transduction histidine kinase
MRYLLLMLVTLLPLLAEAVEFDETTRTLALGKTAQVFEDVGGRATIEAVSSAAMASGFRPLNANALNAGYSRSAFWLKVDLQYRPHRFDVHRDWLLELAFPPLDYVDLYISDESGRPHRVASTGDRLPFASRQLKQNNYLFELEIAPEQSRTVYLRVASLGSIQVPLSLWSTRAYLEEQPARLYFLGLLYGVLLVMLIYNLCIYIGVRDASYLYYILYIAPFGLYQLAVHGTGVEFFWPDSTWWANAAPPFLIGISMLFACQFSRSFLQTAAIARWLDRTLAVLMGFAGLVAVLALNPDYSLALRLANVLVLACTLMIFVAGFMAIARGVCVARYFVIAWSAFLIGSALHTCMLMGYLPNTFFTMNANQIGSAVEVALLSMALTARINHTRDEHARVLVETGEKLERLNEQLAASNRLKDEFLSTLTHELRTPMNGVIGSLELMQTVKMDSELESYQQTAACSAQNMMSMVNGILTLTELRAGRIGVADEAFNLRRLLQSVADTYARSAQHKGLTLTLELNEPLPDSVQGDPNRLRQCIECLLDNAIKFTRTGFVQLRVRCVPFGAGILLTAIEVVDSGIGFTRLNESAPYQRFFQIDGSMTREHGGLGIGLAICAQLIELQGGQLSHRSEPGQGSCFTLSVPLRVVSPQPELVTREAGKSV